MIISILILFIHFLTDYDAIVINEKNTYEVQTIKKALVNYELEVKIFNEKGFEKFKSFPISYDEFNKVINVEGSLLSTNGEEIQKIKNKDIKEINISAFSESVQDNKIKLIEFDYPKSGFPLILKLSYSVNSTNLMFYPRWKPQYLDNVKVLYSSQTIKCPKEIGYRKSEKNLPEKSKINLQGEIITETWEAKELEPYLKEEFSDQGDLIEVKLAPKKYELNKIETNIENWSDYGNFYSALNEGRQNVPENVKQKILEITRNQKSTIEKIKTVYSYLQNNTRYVNISLGIGGWQSKSALDVAENGYGDCKALSNYFISLLKILDINAFPVLIDAGKNYRKVDINFPIMAFNHVIVAVPVEKDTIWAECTSQNNPFNYLGSFTGNRQALLVNNQKSKIVNTKLYDYSKNTLTRNTNINFEDDLSSNFHVIKKSENILAENYMYKTTSFSKEDLKKEYEDYFSISSYSISNFKHLKNNSELIEEIDLNSPNFAKKSGNRIILKPFIFYSLKEKNEAETRKTPLYLNPNEYSFTIKDSILINLPKNYTIESIPKSIQENNDLGSFQLSIKQDGNKISFFRELIVKGGTYSKAEYEKWILFTDLIYKSDNQKIVLKAVL